MHDDKWNILLNNNIEKDTVSDDVYWSTAAEIALRSRQSVSLTNQVSIGIHIWQFEILNAGHKGDEIINSHLVMR